MRYVIPTIQHTGTKLLARMFRGYHWASFIEETEEERVLYLGHLNRNTIENIKKLEYPIITTVRHPYLVAESWKRRGKPLSELIQNFRLLVDEIDKLNPLYLPIDVDNRQQHLDVINLELGLNLETDWGITNSEHNTYDLKREEIEPDPSIKRLTEEIGEFLDRFY